MFKKLFLLLFITTALWSKTLFVVAHKSFPKDHLSIQEIKALFLDKKHLINGKKILAINFPFDDASRSCFEKKILKKSRRYLERYWLKAHYNGKQPPKVVQSPQILFEYLQNIDTAVGYFVGDSLTDKTLKILYQSPCP